MIGEGRGHQHLSVGVSERRSLEESTDELTENNTPYNLQSNGNFVRGCTVDVFARVIEDVGNQNAKGNHDLVAGYEGPSKGFWRDYECRVRIVDDGR